MNDVSYSSLENQVGANLGISNTIDRLSDGLFDVLPSL